MANIYGTEEGTAKVGDLESQRNGCIAVLTCKNGGLFIGRIIEIMGWMIVLDGFTWNLNGFNMI